MDSKVIAVDFDGTLCTDRYPKIGEPNLPVINALIDLQKGGAKLILWACREGELLDEAVIFCNNNGLYFDAVNANLPDRIDRYNNDCRKIFADMYIDDRSTTPGTFATLEEAKHSADKNILNRFLMHGNFNWRYWAPYDAVAVVGRHNEDNFNMYCKQACDEIIIAYLNEIVPDYFWNVPASSSGKYHPEMSSGEGGLVRHTIMAAEVLLQLSRLDLYNDADKYTAICAVLIHDTFKNGYTYSGKTVESHPQIAADEFRCFATDYISIAVSEISCKNPLTDNQISLLERIIKKWIMGVSDAVARHMGQWYVPTYSIGNITKTVELVIMSDYISSRKFIKYVSESPESAAPVTSEYIDSNGIGHTICNN